MIKPLYTYVERTSLEQLLSNFDTIFIKVSYVTQLNEILTKLKEKQFDTSLTKEEWKWHWIQSCLNNQEEIAMEINVANKSVDTISYQHIISELSEPNFWSENKIKKMGRIAVSKY